MSSTSKNLTEIEQLRAQLAAKEAELQSQSERLQSQSARITIFPVHDNLLCEYQPREGHLLI